MHEAASSKSLHLSQITRDLPLSVSHSTFKNSTLHTHFTLAKAMQTYENTLRHEPRHEYEPVDQ